jgi:hypothetical protein
VEGFHEVPLLKDRLFLQEQREALQEVEDRCPTPEVFPDPDGNFWPSVPFRFTYPPSPLPPSSSVERPVLLREVDYLVETNPHSSSSTHQPQSRFRSATAIFQPSRPALVPRQPFRRAPAKVTSSAQPFDNKALQNLLLNNEFLRTKSDFEIESASRNNSTFHQSSNSAFHLSSQRGQKNIPAGYPAVPESTLDESSEFLFHYEKVPKLKGFSAAGIVGKSSNKTKKRHPNQPRQLVTHPISSRATHSTKKKVLRSILKMADLPDPDQDEEFVEDNANPDDDEYLNDSLDGTHILNEGEEYDNTEIPEEEGQIPETNDFVMGPMTAPMGDTTPVGLQVAANPNLDMDRLGTV